MDLLYELLNQFELFLFEGSAVRVLLTFSIILLIFIFIRFFVLWYWKIDKIEKLLKEIAVNTKKESESKEESSK